MDKLKRIFLAQLHNHRAQILLPAVMLAPIFILVVYLLFETAKLSQTKVRQQFALDNSAYSQMSTSSTYLNVVAMINGPSPYRAMRMMNTELKVKKGEAENAEPLTVFDIFYKVGAVPSIGPNYGLGPKGAISNPRPAPESNDWGIRYYGDSRKNWMKEDPTDAFNGKDKNGKNAYIITDKEMADTYFFNILSEEEAQKGGSGVNSKNSLAAKAISDYFQIYSWTGQTYAAQTYIYNDTVRNNRMFRQSYFLNTHDCKESECGKQAAAILKHFTLKTKPMEIDDTMFHVTVNKGNLHYGIYEMPINMTETVESKLFQFAYLTPESRSRLQKMARGVVLKQGYKLPENRFNINLAQRYKPFVRNTVYLTCPRSNNNCVWPNPLPKYSVRVGV